MQSTEQIKKVPIIYELFIEESSAVSGVQAVGIVSEPAISEYFIAHGDIPAFVQEPDYVLTGPFMIPNKLIDRVDEKGELYQVFYSEGTIKQIAQKFFKAGFQNNTSHEHLVPLFGNTVVESWIVQDSEKDKSSALGFKLPVGTWMLSLKISDKEYWREQIVTGKQKGFSIEGFMSMKVNRSTQKHSAIVWGQSYPLVDGGSITVDSDLTVSGVDSAGNTLSPVPDGDYITESGYVICVEGGSIIEWYKLDIFSETPTEFAKYKTKGKKKTKMKTLFEKLIGMFSIVEKVEHKDYSLADGTIVTVDDTTLSAPVYDDAGVEVGTLTITLKEATEAPAPTEAPAEVAAVATEVPVVNSKEVTELTKIVQDLQKELKEIKAGQVKPAPPVKKDLAVGNKAESNPLQTFLNNKKNKN